ncbi:MAG TPA: adenylyl-sulfate kinase [Dongiaceae bacterium]|nr:adenylyl-sulfate kinase [Dongiaceae bacterium]
MSSPYETKQNQSVADVVWHHTQCSVHDRAQLKSQRPLCVWLTGLSASGKSTLANALETSLLKQGRHTYLLDGDNVRHGLNKDLGMSEADRTENIRRVGEVARLMTDAGLIVITAFISPFRADRERVRALFDAHRFVEVFIDTPLHICEQRDPKGMYKKARAGEISGFTGIDSPYEPPLAPDLHIDAHHKDVAECISEMLHFLQPRIQL